MTGKTSPSSSPNYRLKRRASGVEWGDGRKGKMEYLQPPLMDFRDELRGDLEDVKSIMKGLEQDLRNVDRDIQELERKYGISSEEFRSGKVEGIPEEDREEWRELLFYRDRLVESLNRMRKMVEGLGGELENL